MDSFTTLPTLPSINLKNSFSFAESVALEQISNVLSYCFLVDWCGPPDAEMPVTQIIVSPHTDKIKIVFISPVFSS